MNLLGKIQIALAFMLSLLVLIAYDTGLGVMAVLLSVILSELKALGGRL